MNFCLLRDDTPSTGVATTTSDLSKRVADISDRCAFACHDTSTTPSDYDGLAEKLGVTMRIDVVRSATRQSMDIATASGSTTIGGLANNLSGAKTAAAIDLTTTPDQKDDSDMDTDFDGVLAAVNSAIRIPGSGASASATPLLVPFFVSHGVADAKCPSTCSQTP